MEQLYAVMMLAGGLIYCGWLTRETYQVKVAATHGSKASLEEGRRRGARLSVAACAFFALVTIPLIAEGEIPAWILPVGLPIVIGLEMIAGIYAEFVGKAMFHRR